jgi:hypothetical protein
MTLIYAKKYNFLLLDFLLQSGYYTFVEEAPLGGGLGHESTGEYRGR